MTGLNKTTLLLVLRRFPQIGWLPRLYEVFPTNAHQFRIIDRNAAESEDVLKIADGRIPDDLIKSVAACSERKLFPRFANRKSDTIVQWLKGLDSDFVNKHIRPTVDRYTDKIFIRAAELQLPVAVLSEHAQTITTDELFAFSAHETSAIYCFDRHSHGITYTLKITIGEAELPLFNSGIEIMNHQPGWIFWKGTIVRLPEGTNSRRIEPFLTKKSIEVPKRIENDYLKRFVGVAIGRNTVIANGFDVLDVEPQVQCRFSLEHGWNGRPCIVLFFSYNNQPILCNNQRKSFVVPQIENEEVCFVRFRRDFDYEEQCIDLLMKMGFLQTEALFTLQSPPVDSSEEWYHMVKAVNQFTDDIERLKIKVDQPMADVKWYTGKISTHQKTVAKTDWFDIYITVALDDHLTVPFTAFKYNLINNDPVFLLTDGRQMVLPDSWFADFRLLFLFGTAEGGALRLRKMHAGLVAGQETGHQFGQKFVSRHYILTQILDAQLSDYPVPAQLHGTLRPYQTDGFQWMTALTNRGIGGILSDDMGLGKTIQTIALILGRKHQLPPRNPPDPLKNEQLDLFSASPEASAATAQWLIVAPTTLLYNWKLEIERFAPALSVYTHAGNSRLKDVATITGFDVVLVGYTLLRRDFNLFEGIRFDGIVADEAQAIKNPESLTHTVMCSLKANWKVALSGTPVENSLFDLWALSEFVNPGLLGSHRQFKREIEIPSISGDRKLIPQKLLNLLAPFILRRTKAEVTPDLPPLTVQKIYCSMSEEQKELYLAQRDAFRAAIVKHDQPKKNFLALIFKALMQLRLTACNPAIQNSSWTGTSGKTDVITATIASLVDSGNNLLVFSSFVKHLELLARYCDEHQIAYAFLSGKTTDREKVISQYNETSLQVFFISLKAGGTGLNLTKADYVLLCDPWWTPAAEWQAISRAHRIGQTKPVVALSFITEGSIEERIVDLQERKELMINAVAEVGNPLVGLNTADVLNLIDP